MSDNTRLNSILEPGERIVWSGVPQAYSLFGASHKKSTMITLCWALGWAILLVGGYYALATAKNVEIKTGVMAFFIAVPVLVVGMAIADKGKVAKLLYAVTDKRAIILSEAPISMTIADIDAIRIDPADDDNSHIRVGSTTFTTSAKKLPFLAYRGEKMPDSDKTYRGMVFFNVNAKDAKTLRDLLQPATPAANA
ncbi:hypothetical protein LJC23_06260 [Desulfovibrio sp. OttesenSCG-928-I05]|nr:hypothetical protein [Desulfovibrio sp. OttesenSCG-928-I05]